MKTLTNYETLPIVASELFSGLLSLSLVGFLHTDKIFSPTARGDLLYVYLMHNWKALFVLARCNLQDIKFVVPLLSEQKMHSETEHSEM
jgi:hypothetical protein